MFYVLIVFLAGYYMNDYNAYLKGKLKDEEIPTFVDNIPAGYFIYKLYKWLAAILG